MNVAATCLCAKDPDLGPCLNPPTAEDILCDGCRRGCAKVMFTIGNQPEITSNHVEIHWDNVTTALGMNPEPHRIGGPMSGFLPPGVGGTDG